jgi:hypothetical protein
MIEVVITRRIVFPTGRYPESCDMILRDLQRTNWDSNGPNDRCPQVKRIRSHSRAGPRFRTKESTVAAIGISRAHS